MAKTEIRVGGSLRGVVAEAVAAWKAAEAGHFLDPVDRITFIDWAALCSVLTPKRYDLLRHLRREPARGVRALARSLGRDPTNVHADVVALTELGLIERAHDGGLSAPLDEIKSTIRFAA